MSDVAPAFFIAHLQQCEEKVEQVWNDSPAAYKSERAYRCTVDSPAENFTLEYYELNLDNVSFDESDPSES